ncbi:MAG TPA: hypothetical protein VF444_01765 [Pseudonocardiaceae bacterium]
MNMDLTFQGQTASEKGSGVVQYHPSAGDVTMNVTSSSGAGGQAEMILADGVIYMKLPSQEMRAFAQEFNNNELATRPWLKLDPNGTDPLDKAFAPVAKTAQEDDDPAATIARLKLAGTITSTRNEQLDGRSTTHYTITVDTKKLADSLPDSDPEKQVLNNGLQAGGPTSQTVEVWVNSENLPLKITEKTNVSAATFTFSDWGVPVSVAAPPADQVATISGN